MAIDPEKLLRFQIPSASQQVTPKDAALYALSVGMGMDPLDTRQLPYVDPLAGPRMLPSMVLVMAHPGFWMADPQSGVDPAAVLHAAQRFDIFAPVRADMTVNSASRIIGLKDKGPGKAALVDTRTDLTDENGTLLAVLTRTVFVRDGGGFGGEAPDTQPPAAAPTTPPDHLVDLPTAAAQALLYRLNGDYNPLHSDPKVAATAGFDRPILHGLCTMGVIAHAIIRSQADYEADRLTSMSLRFCSPVYPGETIRTEIWRNGAFQARVIERGTLIADQGRFALSAASTSYEMETMP